MDFRDSKFKNFLGPRFQPPNQKEFPTALHVSQVMFYNKVSLKPLAML
jgi:hypothetical protein